MKKLYLAACAVVLWCNCAAAFTDTPFNLGFSSLDFGGKSSAKYIPLEPALAWSTNAYEWGSVNVGSSAYQRISVVNSGNDTAEDVTVSVASPFALCSTAQRPAFGNISAGRTRQYSVRATPTGAGAFGGVGFGTYSAPNIAKTSVALSGMGVDTNPPTTPVISVTPGDTTNLIALTSGGVGATSFDLLWGLSTGSHPNTISGVTLPYTHTGRTNGTAYYYVLNAINSNGTITSSEGSGTPNSVMYSDAFTDTDNTVLSAHSNGCNWQSLPSPYTITGFRIVGNALTTASTFTQTGAFCSASSSDTNQITLVGLTNTSQSTDKTISVRASASTMGYGVRLISLSSGSWTSIRFYKNGTTLSTCTGKTIPAGSNHDLKIHASGTSTVSLTAYVDEVSECTTTDSASPLSGGSPAVYVAGQGTIANNAFDSFQDH